MKFKPKTIWVVEISSCKDCMLVGYAKTYEKALEYGRKYLEEEKRYYGNDEHSRTLEIFVRPVHRIEMRAELYKNVNDRREGEGE